MPVDSQTEFHKQNRRKLMEKAAADGADLVVIGANSFMQASLDRAFAFEQDSNFFYLTGIDDPGVVLVVSPDQEFLIVPELSEVRIAFEGDIDTSAMSNVSGVDEILKASEGWGRLEGLVKNSNKVAINLPSEKYIESVDMFTNPSRARLKELLEDLAGKGSSKIEFVDLRPHFVQMRMIKQDYELAMIRKAIDGTTELFQKIDSILDEAKNEHEIHAEVVKFAINKQMKFAYDPIIAGGPNAVTLHYERNNSKLDKSLPILLDIGLKYRGYSADITRTVCRKPTSRQEAVYNGVLGVQKYAIGLLMPGINLKDYEKRINEYMGEKLIELGLIKTADMESIRKYYPHSTSHFLGIDVHDVADYDRPLEPGMVLTVEPGIYIKDEAIGVRIEDNILITADGNENLSNQLLKELRSLRM